MKRITTRCTLITTQAQTKYKVRHDEVGKTHLPKVNNGITPFLVVPPIPPIHQSYLSWFTTAEASTRPEYYSQPISRQMKLMKPPTEQSRAGSLKNTKKTGQSSQPHYHHRDPPTTQRRKVSIIELSVVQL
ncbi:hypothetical protein WN48_01903 [Eufriesea mexicana]|nr:hypothetical protein WN48_01903 [Eufriesea mexicana]